MAARPERSTNRIYAVLWTSGGHVCSGSLELLGDRFKLRGRNDACSIAFCDVVGAWIARGRSERLRGLPVLALRLRGGANVRIASLEGAGVLHELAAHFERAGLPVAV